MSFERSTQHQKDQTDSNSSQRLTALQEIQGPRTLRNGDLAGEVWILGQSELDFRIDTFDIVQLFSTFLIVEHGVTFQFLIQCSVTVPLHSFLVRFVFVPHGELKVCA